MDMVLIILGLLGLGAVVVSTYVFTVAARTYVSDDQQHRRKTLNNNSLPREPVSRRADDRRSGRPVTFPLTVNSILIANDRRTQLDRRMTN